MRLYLQNIVNDISFENLPAKWQGFDLSRFSKDKTLFDFQKQALQNALKGLWLYFKAQTPRQASPDTPLQEGNSPSLWDTPLEKGNNTPSLRDTPLQEGNIKQLFEKVKNLILPIESLFVFGTNAENLKEIIKTLKEEKQDKNLGEAFILNPEAKKHSLLVPLYKTAERIFAEEKDPQKYPVSREDFDITSQFYGFLGDKIALAKYNCEVKVLRKAKESFAEKERYYDFTEKNSLFEPELILARIFDYLGVKSKELDKFKELENEIVHFRQVKFSGKENQNQVFGQPLLSSGDSFRNRKN